MALAEAKVISSTPPDLTPALKELPQRWWLLLLLITAMMISYIHRSAPSEAGIGILLSGFFWTTRLCRCRAVCYQGFVDEALPDELKDANSLNIRRMIDVMSCSNPERY